MIESNSILYNKIIELYKKDWTADKIAIHLAIKISDVQYVIYKEFKIIV